MHPVDPASPGDDRAGLQLLELLGWSVIFFVAYAHRPLFTSNQVTKFLHGLAAAGYGHLDEDWLASTFNTFPPFTWLVCLLYKIHPFSFLLVMVPVCMVYLGGLLGIARAVGLNTGAARVRTTFFTLVVASHSAGAVQVVKLLTGVEEKGFPGGLAEQYLLGPVFQPNVFGVFIVLSVAAFASRRPIAAAALLAVAPVMHPTYLIGAGVVLALYAAVLLTRKEATAAVKVAAVFLLPIVPLVWFVSLNLSPTDPQTYARANEILAHARIEHHSAPSFLEPLTIAKGVVCLLAVALSWRNVIGWVLSAGLAVGGGLTAVTIATRSDELALIAPWRVSVWVVPVAVCVVLAWVTRLFRARARVASSPLVSPICAAILVLAMISGIVVQISIYQGFYALPWIDAMRYAREHREPGQLYMVPPDLAEFRVQAGVPTLVTWKSHPIKDVEVLAWHDRIVAAEAFYAAPDPDKAGRLQAVKERYGVTHVLVPREHYDAVRDGGAAVFADEHYVLIRLSR